MMSNTKAGRGAWLCAASAGALAAGVIAGPAQAQTVLGPVQVEGAAETYRAEQLQSAKTPAPLDETPRSVTVITREVLKDTAAVSLADALRTVPGITMAAGEGGQPFADRPFLRGYESTTGLLVDGLRDSGSQNRDVFNLESIEVAKGPGGAYAGRGGPGGTINQVTRTPRAEDFVTMTGTVGDPEFGRAVVDVNQMVTDSIAVRAVMMVQESRVPGRDAVTDDRIGFAPSIAFGLGKPTTVTASLYHFESEGLADYGHPLTVGTPVRVPVPGLEQDWYYGLENRDFNNGGSDALTLEVAHEFENGFRLRNISRYSESENDYIASNPDDSMGNVPFGYLNRNVKSRNESNDSWVNQTDFTGTFATGRLTHTFATGLEFSNEKTASASYRVGAFDINGDPIPRGECHLVGEAASNYNCTTLDNPNPEDPWVGTIALNAFTGTEVDTTALYLFDNIDIGERWTVNLGVRWDDYSTEARTPTAVLTNDSDFFSYQAGLTFKPTDTGAVYVSYGTTSSPPGASAGFGGENISAGNQVLEPEEGTNYEAGVKWGLFNDALLVTGAVFRSERTNSFVATAPGNNSPLENIGESRVEGVELSASGQITDRWSLFAGYSYQDSEVIDDGPVATNEGNRLPNTPEHSFTLWTTYQITPDFSAGGGVRYQDSVFGGAANNTQIPDYWVVDAQAEYQVTDQFGLQLNVNNLFDEFYYDRVYTSHMASVGRGRQILLSGTFSF